MDDVKAAPTQSEETAVTVDHCVLCNEPTPYTTATHIDFREGYVEGCGQLCKTCFTIRVFK